jgi:hypothetical protein
METVNKEYLLFRLRHGMKARNTEENSIFPLDIRAEMGYDKQACKAARLYTREEGGTP